MYKSYKGWYKILNPEKFMKPIDEHMKSYKDGSINYKSSLELKAAKFCDWNKHISKWSLEPFNIKYIKPTDGKEHRYYIDFYLEWTTGQKFLVEVKSYNETIAPKPPKKKSSKSEMNFQKAVMTYHINQAKWKAAREFCKKNDMKFIILTEKELN